MTLPPLFLPGHAYVPGKTTRHPEGLFDPVRDSVRPGQSLETLAQSDAFRHGVHYLRAGLFWEAHEVLEPVWMVLPEGEPRQFIQALIQIANARLKLRMERPRAALRLCAIARSLLPPAESVYQFALDRSEIHAWLERAESSSIRAL